MMSKISNEITSGLSLDERIATIHDELSNKQKRLARFILDNKYFISFASANQAAEKTATSAATVVRFAQMLGYSGYTDMQEAVRSELPSYMTAIQRIQVHLETLTGDRYSAPPDDIAQKVFRTDINNIERTANNLSTQKLFDAVEAIVQARRILVIGAGLSASPALFLSHSLRIAGLDARVNLNEGLSLVTDILHCGTGDVLIAIGMWRYAYSTVDSVMRARVAGAKVITITDSIVSPLSHKADFAFEVATDGVSFSLSSVGTMSLLNAIIAALSYRIPEQIMNSLRQVDNAYRENNLLAME